MRSLKVVAATAFGIAALFVFFGGGFFAWWHFYAPRPVIAPLTSEITEKIRTLKDPESLRELALIQLRHREESSKLVERLLDNAVTLTLLTALIAAAALASCASGVLAAGRQEGPSDA
ncbi:hypothetical protein BWI17_03790 [Betaproteobacteria bacterium GR16-43]|nr:hypothetical protein BWI17_03790 [Betaproteobacteria bacterium GR16-43]